MPGEAGVWVFVIGDMLIFALLFAVFVFYRAQDVPLFTASQTTLNQACGAFNTLLMLTSSWFVAHAIHAARAGLGKWVTRFFALAFICGAAFIAVKYFEYGAKLRAGYTITTNDFYMYYYLLTGIHLIHVAIGMGVLSFVWTTARAGVFDERTVNVLESGATFWHMVDVLWIVVFALLYLMR